MLFLFALVLAPHALASVLTLPDLALYIKDEFGEGWVGSVKTHGNGSAPAPYLTQTCEMTRYYALDNGRYIQGNTLQDALVFGEPTGYIDMPRFGCNITSSARKYFSANDSKRTIWTFLGSKLFGAILGFANVLWSGGCNMYQYISGNSSGIGYQICGIGSAALGLASGLQAMFSSPGEVTKTVVNTLYQNFLVVGEGNFQLNNIVNGGNPGGGTVGRGLTWLESESSLWNEDRTGYLLNHQLFAANPDEPRNFWVEAPEGFVPLHFAHEFNTEKDTVHYVVGTGHKSDRHTWKRNFLHSHMELDARTVTGYDPNTWCNGHGSDEYTVFPDGDSIGGCDLKYDGPNEMYFGYDAYQPNEYSALDYDAFTSDDRGNGFAGYIASIGEDMVNNNAWDMCLCAQENNQWTFTGALQFTWNSGAYNGYQQCWNADCNNA